MSDGVFRTGWREYRARRSEFLDPTRVRRRTVLCGILAGVGGAVVVVTQLLWGWTGVPVFAWVVAAVALGAALGCVAAAFVRTARRPQGQPFAPSRLGWRRSERIGAQFSARPPALVPEDRDAVLTRATETIEPAVATIDRVRWIPTFWLCAWVGALAIGLASESIVALLMPLVFTLLQGGSTIAAVTWLGRAELTRRRVEATPAVEPEPPLQSRNAEPRGSKVALPDE